MGDLDEGSSECSRFPSDTLGRGAGRGGCADCPQASTAHEGGGMVAWEPRHATCRKKEVIQWTVTVQA
jgi:hypothetical protein